MKDFVSKGQGNSRYLRSNLPEGTSWDAAVSMLRAGTFPIDFNGVNPDGYTQLGTALNKANLLTDATASALELTGDDPTIDDALNTLASRLRAQVNSYTGTNTYGSANPCELTFDFAPLFVMYIGYQTGGVGYLNGSSLALSLMSFLSASYTRQNVFGTSDTWAKLSSDGKTISWYSPSNMVNQLNASGYTYFFIAVG